MNEAERLAYLDAMGVQSYVLRMTLPGALPSVVPVIEQQTLPENAVTLGKEALKQLHASLASPTKSTEKKPTVQQVSPAQVTTQMMVRFHWVIFQPTPVMLLLVPSAHTDQKSMELLKKILAAIGVVLPIAPLENFVWPPASGSPHPIAQTNSLNDARETLSALLEGYQIKQQKSAQMLKQVLVFDENLGKMLFENVTISGLQLRILPSLQLMLTSPPEKMTALKATAWQRIKDLKP